MAKNEAQHAPSVLVVEDDKLLAHLAVPLFKEGGYSATVCSCGKEALALWQKDAPNFIAAFVDLGLPGMHGFSLVTQMKALHPHIPVIVLTARMEFKDEKEALCEQYGMDDLLIKPLLPADIPHVLGKYTKTS